MTTQKLSLSVRAAITYAFSNSAGGVQVYALSPAVATSAPSRN